VDSVDIRKSLRLAVMFTYINKGGDCVCVCVCVCVCRCVAINAETHLHSFLQVFLQAPNYIGSNSLLPSDLSKCPLPLQVLLDHSCQGRNAPLPI
jgi:hypothetical protein